MDILSVHQDPVVRKAAASLSETAGLWGEHARAEIDAYALACDDYDGRPDDWASLGCSQADWRRFVGARKNSAWFALVRDLDRAGLIRRDGAAIDVSPPRSWLWTLDLGQRDHGPAPPIAA